METPGHLQSQLSWKSDLWGYTSEGRLFSSVVLCRPDTELGVAQTPEGNPAWDAHPSHRNNKSVPFHLGPSGHFSSSCFKAGLTAIVGASVFGLVLFSSYFLPHIFYHNTRSEPAASFSKDWFDPDTCFYSLQQIARADWVRNLSFTIISPSVLSGSTLIFIPIPKKGNAKECSKYHTISLISHAS